MFFKRPSKDKASPAAAPAAESQKSDEQKAGSGAAAKEALAPSELRAVIDAKSLGFKTTADLKVVEGLVGQERAIKALEFGLEMRAPGFNVFVLGPPAS